MKMFMPSPDLAYNSTTFAWWENGFTDEELDAICIMGERASPQSALVGAGVNDEDDDDRASACGICCCCCIE